MFGIEFHVNGNYRYLEINFVFNEDSVLDHSYRNFCELLVKKNDIFPCEYDLSTLIMDKLCLFLHIRNLIRNW